MKDIDRLMLMNQIAIMRATRCLTVGLDKSITASVRALLTERARQEERGRLLAAMYGDGPGAGGI